MSSLHLPFHKALTSLQEDKSVATTWSKYSMTPTDLFYLLVVRTRDYIHVDCTYG